MPVVLTAAGPCIATVISPRMKFHPLLPMDQQQHNLGHPRQQLHAWIQLTATGRSMAVALQDL